jgi:hypothetical protein
LNTVKNGTSHINTVPNGTGYIHIELNVTGDTKQLPVTIFNKTGDSVYAVVAP